MSAGAGGAVGEAGAGLLRLCPGSRRSMLRPGLISDVYFVEPQPFARGKFATVRKIRHLVTGVEYAAKFIRKRRRAVDITHEIYHEVAVLSLCADSPRLVRLHEVYETRTEVVLVLELAAGGELQRILDNGDQLLEGEARHVMRQILEGLAYLHSNRVAHLDLKPQNLLLTADFPHGEVKLCDFGISRVIEDGVEVREILGTPDYVAPEILSYEPISLATDIWSVGVLAYVLLSGFAPFSGDTKQETFLNISQCALTFPPEDFPDISDQAFNFIKAALIVDPKKRMSVQQCLDHPWLNESTKLSISSIGVMLTPPPENYDLQLCVVIPDSDKIYDLEANEENIKENTLILPLRKHLNQSDSSLPFPDAPTTPKMIRKSHPDSPTSVLNHCKKYHVDSPIYNTEKTMNGNSRNKCESDGIYTGKVVGVLEMCKTFEASPPVVNGKNHAKENSTLISKNGTGDVCVKFDSDVLKVSTESTYTDCLQCEVQCCNLVSSHKHTPSTINHVDRAILC